MSKYLYLMRHGETLFNQLHRIQGWCDSPLTELGKKQASYAARYFQTNAIQLSEVHSSTMERAVDTAQLVTSLPVKQHKGLKERNFGRFEGMPETLNPPLPYGDFFVPFGGEGEQEFAERLNTTLCSILDEAEGQHVLVVSHGAACKQFYRNWEHVGSMKLEEKIPNAGILLFSYEKRCFTFQELIKYDESEKR